MSTSLKFRSLTNFRWFLESRNLAIAELTLISSNRARAFSRSNDPEISVFLAFISRNHAIKCSLRKKAWRDSPVQIRVQMVGLNVENFFLMFLKLVGDLNSHFAQRWTNRFRHNLLFLWKVFFCFDANVDCGHLASKNVFKTLDEVNLIKLRPITTDTGHWIANNLKGLEFLDLWW